MAIKKPLEFEAPVDGEDEKGAEARYEAFGRRLELKTQGGGIHKEFSHETGTVQVDKDGLDEFRAREESERTERVARERERIQRENAKLDEVMAEQAPEFAWSQKIGRINHAGRTLLLAFAIFFGIRGVVELFCLAMGRPAPEAWSYVAIALLAGLGLAFHFVPYRLMRIAARLGYASALIYFGIFGLIRLIGLVRNPPPLGIDWAGTGFGLASFALTVICLVGVVRAFRWSLRARAALIGAISDCEHPLCVRYTSLKHKDLACNALYALEAAAFTGVLLVLSVVLLQFNIILLATILIQVPAMLFFYLYPFFAYFFFRKIFYPCD